MKFFFVFIGFSLAFISCEKNALEQEQETETAIGAGGELVSSFKITAVFTDDSVRAGKYKDRNILSITEKTKLTISGIGFIPIFSRSKVDLVLYGTNYKDTIKNLEIVDWTATKVVVNVPPLGDIPFFASNIFSGQVRLSRTTTEVGRTNTERTYKKKFISDVFK